MAYPGFSQEGAHLVTPILKWCNSIAYLHNYYQGLAITNGRVLFLKATLLVVSFTIDCFCVVRLSVCYLATVFFKMAARRMGMVLEHPEHPPKYATDAPLNIDVNPVML